jgi:hypothetical protein
MGIGPLEWVAILPEPITKKRPGPLHLLALSPILERLRKLS